MTQSLQQKLDARRNAAYYLMLNSSNPAQQRLNRSRDLQLMFVDQLEHPRYYKVDNLNAARTVNTDDVWPGGSTGFSLSGSGTSAADLGVWDGGGVLTTHQEFGGRVSQMDSPGFTHYHSTHVAGTMVAAGVSASAKGMSYQANLSAYDWTNDESEMAAAAASGMNVSNHSYGYVVGWYYDEDWYWYGDISVSATEDYGFGYYGGDVQVVDQIAYAAPYYLIVKSAGNDRNDSGPGPGGGHWVWDTGDWVWSTDTRDEDCGPSGYDCVGWKGNAKNILTVGAVNDITGGWTSPGGVTAASFSAYGPTDDGRIKPDIVANGVSLYSALDDNNSAYGNLSGTSMSAPNASGTINLLVRHYEATHSSETPLSSTMKAVVIHTANEAGSSTGPDYRFGWGLLNASGAAQLVADDASSPDRILEAQVDGTGVHEYYLESDGLSPIRVTLAWTDFPGNPPSPAVDPTDLMLINDLDVRLEHVASTTIYEPYVLDPANPAAAATTGDNFRDNVEQIYVAAPAAGTYRVTVSYNGGLAVSPQYYSLVTTPRIPNCIDDDLDGVCAVDDICPDDYNPLQEDADGDEVGDACDVCPGFDDNLDTDNDGVPDGCDGCPNDQFKTDPGLCGCGVADTDTDADGVPDCNDICAGFDDNVDTDADGVPDVCDLCPGADDALDNDSDGVPDGCDACADFDDNLDADSDGIPDGCDICAGFDDNVDTDADGVPDGCDLCPGADDALDNDSDGVPDGCDACAGFDDNLDADSDGIPDGCDICSGFDDNVDTDADGVPDGCDICAGFDDNLDADNDGVPDGCDGCPNDEFKTDPGLCGCGVADTDTDADRVPDCNDLCEGFDDSVDPDADGIPSGCDNCPDDANPDQIDNNGNQIGDFCETCCRGMVGDANGNGGVEPTIGDVSAIIDMLFITEVDVPCFAEADINQSGGFAPTRLAITIGDISLLIDYMFISEGTWPLFDCITVAD
jgi:hypothetical protein